MRRNFYLTDQTLQHILRSELDTPFFQYADKELKAFGEQVANEIDERAKHTDCMGEPKLIKYDKFGDDSSSVWVNEGYRQTVKETYETGIVGYVHKEIPELKSKGNYLFLSDSSHLKE